MKKRKPYNVKVYLCGGKCGHMFHSASKRDKEKCRNCGGELKVIDKYKSKTLPAIRRTLEGQLND